MSAESRRLAIVAALLAAAALGVWVPPLLGGGLWSGKAATVVAADRYLFVAVTYGYARTEDQSVVASLYDLRLRGTLAALPRRLGDWQGHDVDSSDTDLLGFRAQQHVFRDYRDDQGGALWLRLLASSDWQLFYHTPLICYGSSGWQVESESTYVLPMGESQLKMRGFVAHQSGANHLVLYTFLWPSRYRDMSEGATMVEVAVPFSESQAAALTQAISFLRLIFAESPAVAEARLAEMQHRVDANLDNKAALLGYDLSTKSVRRGETLRIVLYWRAIGKMAEDYTVFVHVLNPPGGDPEDRVLAQEDAQPYDGLYPTSRWRVGEVLKEVYELSIPLDAAAGNRELEVGMYLLSTQRRLTVVDAAGRPTGDSVMLPPISVDE
mgnify:CR=1 FL=1